MPQLQEARAATHILGAEMLQDLGRAYLALTALLAQGALASLSVLEMKASQGIAL